MAATRAEQIKLIKLLEEQLWRERHNKWRSWFPDSGKLARSYYKKHLKFFKDTAYTYDDIVECAFIAANRVGKCSTISSYIETPEGRKRMGDIWGKECSVLTYPDREPRRVSAWIRKPAEECYRIVMSDGQWFECPKGHRILTDAGYVRVDELLSRLPKSVFSHPQTSWGFSRLSHALSVRRLSGKLQGWISRYFVDSHLCGGQLLTGEDSVEVYAPLQADVPQRSAAWCSVDGLASKSANILLQAVYRLSSMGDGRRVSGRFASLIGRVFSLVCQWLPCCTPLFGRFLSSVHPGHAVRAASVHRDSVERPCCNPVSIDGNSIVSVYSIGVHTLYDMEVEERHNYIAAGMVHHNSIAGAYCVKVWATGIYPVWWEGRVFDRPTSGWCAGDTSETVRDIIQLELLGPPGSHGTGMLPHDSIIRKTPRAGIPDGVKDIYVRWRDTDKTSYIGLKSYDQKRKSFQGTAKDWIWNDEEPPMDVYSEEILRLMTTRGVLINTFTPLSGLSDVVLSFLPGGQAPSV